MLAAVAALTICSLGVQVGWQPLESGGVEYIIQVSPAELERMANVDDLISEVPAELDVRRYRITVGESPLPRLSSWTNEKLVPVVKNDQPIPADTGVVAATVAKPVEDDSEAAVHKTFADSAEQAEETGPTIPATAQRPVTSTFADPEPRDEEEEYEKRNAPPAAAPPRETPPAPREDDLFDRAASSPLDSRLLNNPRREPEPRAVSPLPRYVELAPSQPRFNPEPPPAERFVPEPVRPNTIDPANEIPVLPAFQTAQRATSERPASFDDVVRDKDSESFWGPVVTIFFFLLLSMGANMWLGWIAWEARMRYQMLLEKYRSMGGKSASDLV